MLQEIKTYHLPMPLKMGSVNCYLIKTEAGFVLIDTGGKNNRLELETLLANDGCQPGNLKLILLTHGDFDHISNAVYLRTKFASRLAMHEGDVGMLERGDMFWNRHKRNVLIKWLAPMLMGFGKDDRRPPDVFVQDGIFLAEYGFNAQVIHTPGHSLGSVCILTSNRDLFCGDLLINGKKPLLNSMMDDPAAGNASLEKLKSLLIKMVYPGHGDPFPMEMLFTSPTSAQ